MNFLEQQRSNRRRTWAVMLAFVVLAMFVGLGFDLFLFGGSQGNVVLPSSGIRTKAPAEPSADVIMDVAADSTGAGVVTVRVTPLE